MHDASATTAHRPAQHMRALERANEVRLARAALKRAIGHGQIAVRDVILRCPWEAGSMTIIELLACQRNWGTSRAGKLLGALRMPETKTVGSMTERQRAELANLI